MLNNGNYLYIFPLCSTWNNDTIVCMKIKRGDYPGASVRNKVKVFRTVIKRPISIMITEYQAEVLRRMCVKFGEPGVPLASMAATAFTRGLMVLSQEIPVELPPVDAGK
jgi:hypothetical protein